MSELYRLIFITFITFLAVVADRAIKDSSTNYSLCWLLANCLLMCVRVWDPCTVTGLVNVLKMAALSLTSLYYADINE